MAQFIVTMPEKRAYKKNIKLVYMFIMVPCVTLFSVSQNYFFSPNGFDL